MIDYQAITEQLNTEKIKLLLEHMNIPYQETESYLLMPTVCHNSDIETASWKLYYYKNTHIFYCYTECSGQSIFSFLKHYYESRNLSYDWYQDIYKVRSGEWTQVRIWSDMNLGTLKKRDLFVTDSRLDPIEDFFERDEYKMRSWDEHEDEHLKVIVERLNNGEVVD